MSYVYATFVVHKDSHNEEDQTENTRGVAEIWCHEDTMTIIQGRNGNITTWDNLDRQPDKATIRLCACVFEADWNKKAQLHEARATLDSSACMKAPFVVS